jgi:hypothetical protein
MPSPPPDPKNPDAARRAGRKGRAVPAAADETHGTFAQVRPAAPPSLRPVADFLRALITSLDKACVEVAWPRQQIASFGVGPRKMSQHYAYIGVHRSHLNLGFYHGASLEDPAGILEGAGKSLRHVKIRGMAAARNPAVRALLVQAIADRRRRPADS